MQLAMTLTREDEDLNEYEIPILVTYTWHPAYKGARDGRYGPPIEPDEPASVDIDEVTSSGKPLEITSSEEETILSAIGEHLYELHTSRF